MMWILPIRVALLGALAIWSATGIASAGAVELLSHRAIYSLALGEARRGGEIIAVKGQIHVETADTCDGWTLYQRLSIGLVDRDGAEVASETAFASWETKDGLHFRFHQLGRADGRDDELINGTATADPLRPGRARFVDPERRDIPLPAGTLFPIGHLAALITAAEAGKRIFSAVVFDGSSLANPSQVSAFIGDRETLPSLLDQGEAVTAWPVRAAFFPLGGAAEIPDVEIGIVLQADGVMREIELVYEDFSIRAELTGIEIIPPIAC